MKEKREKENKYSAWIVLLSVLTIGIEIAGAAGIIRVLFSAYPKLYPALHLQGEGKIGMLMLLLWIAAAAAVVFFVVIFIKKLLSRSASLILSICMIPGAAALNLIILFMLLLMPPVASRTSDPADYMAVDGPVQEQEEFYSLIFPEQLSQQAQDVEYYYEAYETFFTLDYTIFASWTLPGEEYASMKEKILADTEQFRRAYGSEEQSETQDGTERYVVAEMDPGRYYPMPEMTVDFDDTACRISSRAYLVREF